MKNAAKKPVSTQVQLLEVVRVIGFVVGIEDYQSRPKGQELQKVDYARNDAEAFKSTIEEIYEDAEVDVEICLDSAATQGNLRYGLQQTIAGLKEDDLFVFYYAGHGYHDSGGNRITAWDSSSFHPQQTTLLINEILIEPLRASKCQRALIFIDACATAVQALVKSRDVISSLNANELEKFLGSAQYCATFLSCSPGQKSYPSVEYQHGVWTYFLLRALRGDAPSALGPGRYLTDVSLRDYLATAVPQYVTEKRVGSGKQTPMAVVDSQHTFALREVPTTRSPISEAGDYSAIRLEATDDFLESLETHKYTALPGGSRFVPKVVTDSTITWVRSSLQSFVDEEIKQTYQMAKQAFSLRARDFTQSTADGVGGLDCDFFRYSVTPGHSSKEPANYYIQRRLYLREGWENHIPAFDDVFGSRFERVVVRFKPDPNFYDDYVEIFEGFEDEHGGQLDEDAANSTIKYFDSKGAALTINLDKGRLTLSGSPRAVMISQHVKRVRTFRFGVSGPTTLLLTDV
jgi:uncharacterized caspase-like protein